MAYISYPYDTLGECVIVSPLISKRTNVRGFGGKRYVEPTTVQVSFSFTDTEEVLWAEFYRTTLVNGTKLFTMSLPVFGKQSSDEDVPTLVKFVDLKLEEKKDGVLWTSSYTLEVIARAVWLSETGARWVTPTGQVWVTK